MLLDRLPRRIIPLLALVAGLALGLLGAPSSRAAELETEVAAAAPVPVRCPMLYYHEVPGQAGLAAQLTAFLQAGYRPVAMGQLAAALDGRFELPPGCMVLTFDDGLASQLTGALPVLLRFAVPATFFVMPGFTDRVHRYMSLDDFRTLRDSGMEIGSHTLNHASLPPLLRFNLGAFQAEVVTSKAILERELGVRIDLFAYPNGAWDYLSADEVRKAGYLAAASTLPGGVQRPEERYWLRRFRADSWEAPATVLARLRR
jgi:peptidoglycan/xylan/chitin deacetylase (PgdA/CDA1 family)